jgi:hypothetical protein
MVDCRMKLRRLLLGCLVAFVLPHASAQVLNPRSGATATQFVLTYSVDNSQQCMIEVSEVADFSRLVHALDPLLFPGANHDGQSNIGMRMFVVGQRRVKRGADGRWYSLALAANTTHYLRISGCVAHQFSGAFTTSNMPYGNTYLEPSLWDDERRQYLFPTMPAKRNEEVIDPQTGARIRRITLPEDNTLSHAAIVRGVDAGFFHVCSDTKTDNGKPDVNGGYRCAIQWGNGARGILYWIRPSGLTRRLGIMRYNGDGATFNSGWVEADTGFHVDGNPAYSNFVYKIDNSPIGPLHNKIILLRLTQNRDSEVAPNADWAAVDSAKNLTPGGATLTDLLLAFDPNWDPRFRNCTVRAIQSDHLVFQCQIWGQDSLGYIGVLNLGDRAPLDNNCNVSRQNCLRVEALIAVGRQPVSRWCGIHSTMYVRSQGWKWVQMSPKTPTSDASSGGPSQVSLLADVSASTTTLRVQSTHNGEPVSPVPGIGYVMDAAAGDYAYFDDNHEFVRIAGKSQNEWTVERGCHAIGSSIACDGSGALPHGAAAHLVMSCTGADLNFAGFWWDYLAAPHGDSTGKYWVRDTAVANCHRVSREPYDICEGYSVRKQTPWTGATFGTQPDFWIDAYNVGFAGVKSLATSSTYLQHETWNQADGNAAAQSWFTDQAPFVGGPYRDGKDGHPHTKVNGTTYIWKYSWDQNGHPFDWRLPYFSISGTVRMPDISGPADCRVEPGSAHCLQDEERDNDKFCVVKVANECWPGSQPREAYANFTNLVHKECSTDTGPAGTDWCLNHPSWLGHYIPQISLLPANVTSRLGGRPGYGMGRSRILVSHTMTGWYRRTAGAVPGHGIANVLSDGSWILFNCPESEDGTYTHYCIVQVPPPPGPDGFDRSNWLDVPDIEIKSAGEDGITSSATRARVKYGYEENGPRTRFYCTARPEPCYVPDLPLGKPATLKKVGIPQHVLFYQVEYLDHANRIVGTGRLSAVALP